MTQTILQIQNLSKTFYVNEKPLPVISSLSITVKKGEFVSIIGPSGCGKTTILNIITGLERETSGKILLDGAASYMLQKPLLLPWKNTLENVMLGLLLKHVDISKARQQATEMLKKFHLDAFANHYPYTLSGGMAQRVALLRTILFNNQFLLMDEPFGALDALTRLSMQLWLLDVWQTYKSSVLLVTHDIWEAIFLSDKVYVLSNKPATVIQEVFINLPRPRKREFLRTKKSIAIEQKLEELLLKQSFV